MEQRKRQEEETLECWWSCSSLAARTAQCDQLLLVFPVLILPLQWF